MIPGPESPAMIRRQKRKNGDTLAAMSAFLMIKANATDGITQKEIAAEFGLSQQTISRILRSHPGFKRSLRPFDQNGYYFDPDVPAPPVYAKPVPVVEPPVVEQQPGGDKEGGDNGPVELVQARVERLKALPPEARLEQLLKVSATLAKAAKGETDAAILSQLIDALDVVRAYLSAELKTKEQ